ncbi:MAG: DUF4190 domain-containing protein [Propionibacteriales bacterium]|nr:DUF4190 domain-containing protein [Propionibacteriales bacterium]
MRIASATTNGLAITSLILGVVGFVCGLTSIPAVILGHIAMGQIKRQNQGGHGLAIAGLVMGYLVIGFVTLCLIILAVAPETFE